MIGAWDYRTGSRAAKGDWTPALHPKPDRVRIARELTLVLVDRAAGVAPGAETAFDMGDRTQPHALQLLGRQGRPQAAGAEEDELLARESQILRRPEFGLPIRRYDRTTISTDHGLV